MATHRAPAPPSSEEDLARLVERTRAGDEVAWSALWLALAPLVESVARRSRVTGRLSRDPDGPRDIVTRVMGELHEDGFRRLAQLAERLACRDGSFRAWVCTIARNSAVSHVRQHPEHMGRVEGGAPRWAQHVPLSDALEDERPPVSRRAAASRILAQAGDVLEPAQLHALHRWLRGEDFAEIAAALHLRTDDAAARLVRAAVKQLRRRFAAPARAAERVSSQARTKSTGASPGSVEKSVL